MRKTNGAKGRRQRPVQLCQRGERASLKAGRQKAQGFIFSGVLLMSLVMAVNAFAAGAEHPEATLTGWLSTVINFLVLFVILFFAARKPMRDYFRKRTEMIEKSIKEAEEAKELARKSLEEVRERLKNTDREINEILEASKKSGEKEKEALIAEGHEMKNKILEQARANIEFELQKAKKAIKSEAALMAIELAEKQIKEKLGKEGQETLIDEYIRKLETTK